MSHTTRWSLVLAARGGGDGARDALAELCSAYRPVLLAYFRRHGDPARAEDETQAFFLHFLQQRLAERADPLRGSFRAFLYASAENHRRKAWRAETAAKRGGERHGDADALDTLADPQPEPGERFDRDWALHVLQRARQRLRAEAVENDRAALFEALQGFILEAPEGDDYARAAANLGMTPNHVAVAVKRLRERLRALVRTELADTLGPEADLEAELRWLRAALGSAASSPG